MAFDAILSLLVGATVLGRTFGTRIKFERLPGLRQGELRAMSEVVGMSAQRRFLPARQDSEASGIRTALTLRKLLAELEHRTLHFRMLDHRQLAPIQNPEPLSSGGNRVDVWRHRDLGSGTCRFLVERKLLIPEVSPEFLAARGGVLDHAP